MALATAFKCLDGSALAVDYLLSFYLVMMTAQTELPAPSAAFEASSGQQYGSVPAFHVIYIAVLRAAYALSGLWFWAAGINHVQDTTYDAQSAIVFLFPLRTRAWTISAAVIAALFGAACTFVLWQDLKGVLWTRLCG